MAYVLQGGRRQSGLCVASILTKLGVHSRLQAVLFALRYGVIQLT